MEVEDCQTRILESTKSNKFLFSKTRESRPSAKLRSFSPHRRSPLRLHSDGGEFASRVTSTRAGSTQSENITATTTSYPWLESPRLTVAGSGENKFSSINSSSRESKPQRKRSDLISLPDFSLPPFTGRLLPPLPQSKKELQRQQTAPPSTSIPRKSSFSVGTHRTSPSLIRDFCKERVNQAKRGLAGETDHPLPVSSSPIIDLKAIFNTTTKRSRTEPVDSTPHQLLFTSSRLAERRRSSRRSSRASPLRPSSSCSTSLSPRRFGRTLQRKDSSRRSAHSLGSTLASADNNGMGRWISTESCFTISRDYKGHFNTKGGRNKMFYPPSKCSRMLPNRSSAAMLEDPCCRRHEGQHSQCLRHTETDFSCPHHSSSRCCTTTPAPRSGGKCCHHPRQPPLQDYIPAFGMSLLPAAGGGALLEHSTAMSPVASRSLLTCSDDFQRRYPHVYQGLCKGLIDISRLIAQEVVIPIKEEISLHKSAIRSRWAVTATVSEQLWKSVHGKFPDPKIAPKLVRKIADYFYDKIEAGIAEAEDDRSLLQWMFRFDVENGLEIRLTTSLTVGPNSAICNIEGTTHLRRRKGEFLSLISKDMVILDLEIVVKALFLNGGQLAEINRDPFFSDCVTLGENRFASQFLVGTQSMM